MRSWQHPSGGGGQECALPFRRGRGLKRKRERRRRGLGWERERCRRLVAGDGGGGGDAVGARGYGLADEELQQLGREAL